MDTSVSREKSFDISKWEVWEAYRRVKANKGAPGVDGQTIEEFETNLKDNLYRVWLCRVADYAEVAAPGADLCWSGRWAAAVDSA